ncbi:hypothetical protein AVEN_242830-1 [Araneus ventricosus]|uniref:THAP9-like helix-turn-helix domain-containing protein n=1 Tax=Araneus ventricosus TaxID=182803 RepID=A0A4Y2GBA9_ARAVE|nr:hypothetical protein AVEN_242830-1 [Araneus ventricosus]
MFDGPALEMLLRASGLKKGKYAPELRSFALTLHFYSKKAYVYVRKVFKTCLPHTSTVKKWYQVVDGSPGFTKEGICKDYDLLTTAQFEHLLNLSPSFPKWNYGH